VPSLGGQARVVALEASSAQAEQRGAQAEQRATAAEARITQAEQRAAQAKVCPLPSHETSKSRICNLRKEGVGRGRGLSDQQSEKLN